MRLVTRSDFDGLVCGVLLKAAGIIDNFIFVHPKDLQDGLVEITQTDCLANVPFVEGCGLWFDHHSSEQERNAFQGKYEGVSKSSPSAARIIYDYYGGSQKFHNLEAMMESVDKVDSGMLTKEEILNPTGWILLGFLMDPRTGLGRFRNFTISNYQLMENLITLCYTMPIEEILNNFNVQERITLFLEQNELFKEMILANSTIKNEIIITDLRGLETIYTGNRFLIYSLFPEQNVSIWIVSGKDSQGCSCAVGHSIINRTSSINVGTLMLKYGGGGHRAVGTCQFNNDNMQENISNLIDDMIALNN